MSDNKHKKIFISFDHNKLSFPATKLFCETPIPSKSTSVDFTSSPGTFRPKTANKKKTHWNSTATIATLNQVSPRQHFDRISLSPGVNYHRKLEEISNHDQHLLSRVTPSLPNIANRSTGVQSSERSDILAKYNEKMHKNQSLENDIQVDSGKSNTVDPFYLLKLVKTAPQPAYSEYHSLQINLPKLTQHQKTVIFDLDETLIFCSVNLKNPDKKLQIPLGITVTAGINIRPYATDILRMASRMFEVIIFTASTRNYADPVIDLLDPTKKYISHRLYRDNCLLVNGLRVKDLSVLVGRSLSNTVIIDNSIYSFGNQIDNGIPIKAWHDDKDDRELLKLMHYLKDLAVTDDVRDLNRRTFGLQKAFEFYMKKSQRLMHN